MANLYLYIGAEKTGTTTLQYTFWENKSVINAAGLYSPYELFNSPNQMELATAFLDIQYCRDVTRPPDNFAFKSRLHGFLNKNKNNDLYFISEHLSSRFASQEEVDELIKFLSGCGHNVIVVACLRHPDSWLRSAYGEYIKCGGTASLRGVLNKSECDPGKLRGFRYLENINVWFNAIGVSECRVLDYKDLQSFGLINGVLVSFDRSKELYQNMINISGAQNNKSISLVWYFMQRFLVNRVSFLRKKFIPRRHKFYRCLNVGPLYSCKIDYPEIEVYLNRQRKLFDQYLVKYKFQTEA